MLEHPLPDPAVLLLRVHTSPANPKVSRSSVLTAPGTAGWGCLHGSLVSSESVFTGLIMFTGDIHCCSYIFIFLLSL